MWVAELLAERPWCEARIELVCTRRATDAHEPRTRARFPGIHTDPSAAMPVCRPCHSWIDSHQVEAHELGLLVHSWE